MFELENEAVWITGTVQYSYIIARRNKYLLLLAVWDREALHVAIGSTEMKLLVQTTACYCGCAPLGRYLKNCLCPFLRWQGMVKRWWKSSKMSCWSHWWNCPISLGYNASRSNLVLSRQLWHFLVSHQRNLGNSIACFDMTFLKTLS